MIHKLGVSYLWTGSNFQVSPPFSVFLCNQTLCLCNVQLLSSCTDCSHPCYQVVVMQ